MLQDDYAGIKLDSIVLAGSNNDRTAHLHLQAEVN